MTESNRERLVVFHVGAEYLFAAYVPDDCFAAIREHYDDEAYRFAVPEDDFDDVAETLRDYGYDPRVVEDVAPYVVVMERFEPHADILRASVASWRRRGHEFFLLPGERAVEEAVANGATPVSETEFVVGL